VINEVTGEIEDVKNASSCEFYVTHGEKEKLRGKGIYFLRMTAPGKGINPSGTNDNEVLFGEISNHIVPVLNTIVNQVYKPLVEKLEDGEWKMCEIDQKKEFLQTFDKFAKELTEAQESFKTSIKLESYDEDQKKNLKEMQNKKLNADLIPSLCRTHNKWQETIDNLLTEINTAKIDKEAGPVTEIEHWKNNMRKLTSISEQLRTENCRTVCDALEFIRNNFPD